MACKVGHRLGAVISRRKRPPCLVFQVREGGSGGVDRVAGVCGAGVVSFVSVGLWALGLMEKEGAVVVE